MAATPEELVQQLEDSLILGEILESDYKKLKFKLFEGLSSLGMPPPASGGSIVQAEIVDSRESPFCYVPDEAFMYGVDNHFAEIGAPYYLAKYPVTVREFLTFLTATGYDFDRESLKTMRQVSPSPDCPAVCVSWADAKAYCQWLRRQTREYYNLPSELEWEKGARGVDGRFYPWGNKGPLEGRCRFQVEGEEVTGTVPVDSFAENVSPTGVLGTIGNCWEWCADPCDLKPGAHMVRGGSWANDGDYVSTVARSFVGPETLRSPIVGFRLLYIPGGLLFQYKNTETPASVHSSATLLYMEDLINDRMRQDNREDLASISAQLDLTLMEADGDRREAVQALNLEIVDTLDELAKKAREEAPQAPGDLTVVDAQSAARGRIKLGGGQKEL